MSGSAIAMPNEIVGILPWPEAELVHLLEQQLGVGNHGRQEEQKVRSGRADFSEPARWRRRAAGVKVSSTISCSPFSASRPSRIAFAEDTDAAVLSVTIATVLGFLAGAAFRQLHDLRQACFAAIQPSPRSGTHI
jgi:hypothetical protein